MRVQVKATRRPEPSGRYKFHVSRGRREKVAYTTADTDIIALVAIDIRRVYFIPTKELTTQTLRKAPGEYSPFVEAETWHRSINSVIGSQWSD